jgi:acetyl esterase/lipase
LTIDKVKKSSFIMPPVTYIQVAGNELFHDQVVEISEHFKHQKDVLTLDVYATQSYVFQVSGSHLEDNKHATGKIAAFLQSVKRSLA